MNSTDIINKLEKNFNTFTTDPKIANVGVIERVGDGVVTASGLSQAQMGEIVIFANGSQGVVLNLEEDAVSIILLDRGSGLQEGASVKTTGTLLSINASDALLGRVINPLGESLDGKSSIAKGKQMPLERIAAGVVDRQPVEVPLKTGIKAIDALIPIGRGQRELIIGDRGLGKTAIAVDTIINQKQYFAGASAQSTKSKEKKESKPKRVLCVYVAIGQKQSTIAQVVEKLRETDALAYTVVIASSASDPAAQLYLAPFAGVAIAEYFLEKGEDVLIVYDDLSKHAWAWRQLSLVLKRPAGREAYPGDVFYLHSRLLERAVRLNEANGGGSITALPVIETQADDISAYIPTNVISITDGQIFLKSDLFNSGTRPAVDVGNSVSRVGGAAQTGAVKSVAGKLKLELAQYRELAVFAQFGSDLDKATIEQLERGKRLTAMLNQPQYQPLSEAFEILSIWVVTNGYTSDIPVAAISRFEKEYHAYVQAHGKKIIERLSNGKKLDDDANKSLREITEKFKKTFSV